MADTDLDAFWVHSASVETLTGSGAYGDVFAAAVVIACFVDDSRKLIRNTMGQEVVSESTLYTSILNSALFTPDSKVTVLGDADNDELTPARAARVIKVNANDSGGLDLPDHVAVSLT